MVTITNITTMTLIRGNKTIVNMIISDHYKYNNINSKQNINKQTITIVNKIVIKIITAANYSFKADGNNSKQC